MITEQQYQAAKGLAAQYEQQESRKAIEALKCICCQKRVEPVFEWLPPRTRLEEGMWKDGTVARITFGYGSRLHDDHSYYIALCDSCIRTAVEYGITIPYQQP